MWSPNCRERQVNNEYVKLAGGCFNFKFVLENFILFCGRKKCFIHFLELFLMGDREGKA